MTTVHARFGRARKAAVSPLDVQFAALREVYEQIPPDQQPSFLGRLDEVCRAWTGQLTAEASYQMTSGARS